MGINFNPNLPPKDSLTPSQIQSKAEEEREKLQTKIKQAYEVGGVPENAADRASKTLASGKQSSIDKKNIKDANIWWHAKHWKDDDEG